MPGTSVLIDNFESYPTGAFPDRWVYVERDRDIRTHEQLKADGEAPGEVTVRQESSNQYVQLVARNDVVRYTQRNGPDFNWNVRQHPIVQWRWRAERLPKGASERDQNDTGAALYVTFDTDWIGRPKSIKYTYSSSLPVGTTVDFGSLQVIVVDSKATSEMNVWHTATRHVANDYQRLFGEAPPKRPLGITIWSDSDTTGGVARVGFDDIRLLAPSPSRPHN
jgi:hypothetical protein